MGNDKQPTVTQIYERINDVLGGTNPQQMLCLMIPGTVLDKKTFVYDTRYEKPIKVAANESRLVNKMFDVCTVTGSDNGRMLSTQFLSAIDALTPKMNSRLIKAKDELRELLRTPMSYQLEDGSRLEGNLQQVFYYLYGDYVKEKKIWADKQNEKKEELEKRYPLDTDEDLNARQEEYLKWYQTVAESYLLNIQVKRGKVLAIFSINDMKIIEGVLDSGSGAELEEAREQVNNAKKFDPDGGYVYPVELQPEDWFESLDSSMGYVDLLQSSDAYVQQYSALHRKRKALLRKIAVFEQNNKNKELAEAVEDLKKAQQEMEEAEKSLSECYADNANLTLGGVLDLIPEPEGDEQAAQTNTNKLNTMGTALIVKKLLKPDTLNKFNDAYKRTYQAQAEYVKASQKIADASRVLIAAKSKDYTLEIKECYLQLDELNEEIEEIKGKLSTAIIKEQNADLNEQLFPDAVERRYSEILIHTDSSSMTQSSSEHSSSSTSSAGVNFFFGGAKREKSHAEAMSNEDLKSADMSIDIGFLATKVSVVRNWFNPGVFLLSKDMYRTSSAKISSGSKNPNDQKNCIFPCYPTAFVIAKDISIKISFGESASSSIKTAVEEHASTGGGFLCFSGRKSSSSSDETSTSVSSSSNNEITIKIPGSQIIGYYLQITPYDESTPLSSDTEDINTSITEFVKHCKEVLNDKMA